MQHIHALTKTRPAKAQEPSPLKEGLRWFNFTIDVLIVLTRMFGPKVL